MTPEMGYGRQSKKSAAFGDGILPLEPCLDDIGGATDTGIHRNRPDRAIGGAGAAFHAAVMIEDPGFRFLHPEHGMRTHLCTYAAADAFLLIKFKGRNIFQMPKLFHCRISSCDKHHGFQPLSHWHPYPTKGAATQAMTAASRAAI